MKRGALTNGLNGLMWSSLLLPVSTVNVENARTRTEGPLDLVRARAADFSSYAQRAMYATIYTWTCRHAPLGVVVVC